MVCEPSKYPWDLLLEDIEDKVGRRQRWRGNGWAGGGGRSSCDAVVATHKDFLFNKLRLIELLNICRASIT